MYGIPSSLAGGIVGLIIGMLLLQAPMIIGQIVSAWNQRYSSKIQAETSRRIASGTIETSTAGEVQNWERDQRTYVTQMWKEEIERRKVAENCIQELRKQLLALETRFAQGTSNDQTGTRTSVPDHLPGGVATAPGNAERQ